MEANLQSTPNNLDQLNILSVDPGGRTGIAMQLTAQHKQQLIDTLITETPEQLYDLFIRHHWDIVLCERFATAGRMSKYGLYTVQLVGGLSALCYLHQTTFVYRQPQNRKAFQDIAHDWFKGATHEDHQEDALAHLLAWKAKSIETLTLVRNTVGVFKDVGIIE